MFLLNEKRCQVLVNNENVSNLRSGNVKDEKFSTPKQLLPQGQTCSLIIILLEDFLPSACWYVKIHD